MLVCYTRGSRFEYTFFAEIIFKFYRFCRFYRIHLGKTLKINFDGDGDGKCKQAFSAWYQT